MKKTETARKPFNPGVWQETINVRDFIQTNYKPYEGDESFLVGTTENTQHLWDEASDMVQQQILDGTVDVALDRFSGIDAFEPGYQDKEREVVVGFQADAPLRRIMNPYGGFRMVESSLKAYGLEMDPKLADAFNEYRKSHNQGVFDAYTKEMRAARSAGLLTGLPDAYGRGRIIGDYRRVALYGIDRLKKAKQDDLINDKGPATEERIRHREELTEQIRALDEIKNMAARYGFDISRPAETAQEAVQWLYFGYLAAIKENNGAAMSFGRNTTFLDIYIERDIEAGLLTESEAQS